MPRAPSPVSGVTFGGGESNTPSVGITPPSSLLRAHAPDQIPLTDYGFRLVRRVFAGCCQPLLGDGPSRRLPLRLLPHVLGPLPRLLPRCTCPFLPARHWPSLRCDQVGGLRYPISDFPWGGSFGAAVIPLRSGPWVCSPLWSLLPSCATAAPGSRGFYVRAEHGALPSHASDMLAVQIGQLTAGDSHPFKVAACRLLPQRNPL